MEKVIYINSSQEMINMGKKIGSLAEANMVIALDGDLGAGKTTLTKGIALGLGITKIVNSPTFVIMKIYDGRLTLYHLDVYRTNDSEFELTEYFELDGLCVIEWSENIATLLPKATLKIKIVDMGDNKRKVIVSSNDKWYERMINAL